MSISTQNVYIWKHRLLRIDQCLRGPNPQHHRRKRIAFSAMDYRVEHPKLQWVSRLQYFQYIWFIRLLPSLKLTKPIKVGHKETNKSSNRPFFRCYVSFSEGIGCNMFQGAYSPWDIYPNIPPCAGTCWWHIRRCEVAVHLPHLPSQQLIIVYDHRNNATKTFKNTNRAK